MLILGIKFGDQSCKRIQDFDNPKLDTYLHTSFIVSLGLNGMDKYWYLNTCGKYKMRNILDLCQLFMKIMK